MSCSPALPRPSSRATRVDLLVLGLATVVLRLPAYLADRHLTFDDGVYGASAVAMRAGGAPFRDVFSSQGPLFLPLVWLGDVLGLRTANAPRVLAVLAGLALVAAVYASARQITDRTGGLIAAAVTSATASVLWVTAPLASDGVAIALATVTMALTLAWRDDITVRRAVVLGLGIGATISIKALLLPVALPVALVLLAGRRLAPIVAGAATTVAFHLVLWLPWGVGDVWDQAYGYHLEVTGQRTPGANLAKVLSTLGDRDLPVVVLALAAVAAVALGRREAAPAHEARLRSPDVLLGSWLLGSIVLLLLEHPLWRPHVSQLVPAVVLLAVRHRPPLRALAALAVLTLPYHLVHAWEILQPSPFASETEQARQLLRDLPAGALAISDDPGLVWRAGRRTPPDLVDASKLRIDSGRTTSASVAEAAAAPDVCGVAVRSEERWGSFDDLPGRLADAGYEVAYEDQRGRTTYIKASCNPG
jgi:hypothetical protein